MATITPSSHIASISGRLSRTDSVHTRANKTTGMTYGVALTNPNPQTHPTVVQQRARTSFRDTWHAVDILLAVPALRTYFTALWQAHTAACRHHRPLSQSVFDAIPRPAMAEPVLPPALPLLSLFGEGAVEVLSLLRSRRTPFSTPRTLLFRLLYR